MEDSNYKTLQSLLSHVKINKIENWYIINICGKDIAKFCDINILNMFIKQLGMNEYKE